MTLLFFGLAAALAAVVILLLVPTLWRGPKAAAATERSAVNAAVYRDQLAELERDRAGGVLSEADFDQARAELQRRVLDEATADEPPGRRFPKPRKDEPRQDEPRQGSRRTAIALAVALPVAAIATYLVLGNPTALSPEAQRPPQVTAAQVEAMVAGLAQRLQKNPDDPEGWAMLGRSYRALSRYDESAQAFAKAGSVIESDPQLLVEYAETLAMARGGDLGGKPTELLQQALKLDPQHALALVLAGSAAFERSDYADAIGYWQRAQTQVAPDSEDARAIAESIDKARAEASRSKPRSARP